MTQISDDEQASTTFGAQPQGSASPAGPPPWIPSPGNAPQWGPAQGQMPYGQPQYWGPQGPGGWQQPNGAPYPYPMMQPYFMPMQPPAPPRTTNGTAIFAFIMSLLWLGGIGSVLGLVFGIVGAKECDRTGQPGHGLASAAAILGLFGLLLAPFFLFA